MDKLAGTLNLINGSADYNAQSVVDELPNELSTTYYLPSMTAADDNVIGTSIAVTDYDRLRVLFANYFQLVAGGLSVNYAAKVAITRVNLMMNGLLRLQPGSTTVARFCKRGELLIVPDHFDDITEPEPGRYVFTERANTAMVEFAKLDVEVCKVMATYLPVWAHMSFVKTEHHYRPDQTYATFYSRQFTSCKMINLIGDWNHVEIIYNAVHFLGPYNMLRATETSFPRLDRGVRIKFPITPAGTAAIVACEAVINAAKAWPGFELIVKAHMPEWETIQSTVKEIQGAYARYHTRHDLFGFAQTPKSLIDAHNAVVVLAPAAQAFINKMCQGSPLAEIKSLKKVADTNIGVLKRYETLLVGSQTQLRRAAANQPMSRILSLEEIPKPVPKHLEEEVGPGLMDEVD